MKTLEERLLDKVVKGYGGECWQWVGYAERGYGKILLYPEMRVERVHRVSWQLANGPIPQGKHVLHRCDNPGCVRPDHLFLGNHDENMKDAMNKGRIAKGEDSGRAKLKEEDIPAIRESTLSLRELGRMFGVDHKVIHKIKVRKLWRHVP